MELTDGFPKPGPAWAAAYQAEVAKRNGASANELICVWFHDSPTPADGVVPVRGLDDQPTCHACARMLDRELYPFTFRAPLVGQVAQ